MWHPCDFYCQDSAIEVIIFHRIIRLTWTSPPAKAPIESSWEIKEGQIELTGLILKR